MSSIKLTGEQLRTAIAEKYYSSFDEYKRGFNLGKAIQNTSCRDLENDFETAVQEKIQIYERKVRKGSEQYYKKEKKNIETKCDPTKRVFPGGLLLPPKAWGGRDFDYLVYAYFYEKSNRIVRIYVLEEVMGLQWFSTTERIKTDTVQSTFEAKIESQSNERTNIFLESNGNHYNVLKVKRNTTEKQLNEFNRISTNGAERRKYQYKIYFQTRKQRYFEEVEEKDEITGDGMCYWNAIAEAFFWRERIELPEGRDIREKIRGESSPPPPQQMVDWTVDPSTSPVDPSTSPVDLTRDDRKVSPDDRKVSPVGLTEDSTSVPIQRFLREFLEQYKDTQTTRGRLNLADGVLRKLAVPCLKNDTNREIRYSKFGASKFQDAADLFEGLLSKTGADMRKDFEGRLQITRSCTGTTSDGTTLTYRQEPKISDSYVFQIGKEDWKNGLEKMLNETIKQWGGDLQNKQHQQEEITFQQATDLWNRTVDSIIMEKKATLVKIKKTVIKIENGREVTLESSFKELERPYNRTLYACLWSLKIGEYMQAYLGTPSSNTKYSFVFYLECETGEEKQTYIPQLYQKYLAIQLKIMKTGTNGEVILDAPTQEEYRNIITEEITVRNQKFKLTGMVLFGDYHYTARIKTQNGWFLVNDEAVTPLRHWYGNWEGRSPYLLFYSKGELATGRPIGLINGTRNICYANAVLQNLANLPNIVDTLPPSTSRPSAQQRGKKRPSAQQRKTKRSRFGSGPSRFGSGPSRSGPSRSGSSRSGPSRSGLSASVVGRTGLQTDAKKKSHRQLMKEALRLQEKEDEEEEATKLRTLDRTAQNKNQPNNYVKSKKKQGENETAGAGGSAMSTSRATMTYDEKVKKWEKFYRERKKAEKEQNSKNRTASFSLNRRLLL